MVFSRLTLDCLAIKHRIVRAREVNRAIEKLGGVHTRTVGSHKRYEVSLDGATASTAVPQHPGDIPKGTLDKIRRDLEPVLGRKWLL